MFVEPMAVFAEGKITAIATVCSMRSLFPKQVKPVKGVTCPLPNTCPVEISSKLIDNDVHTLIGISELMMIVIVQFYNVLIL